MPIVLVSENDSCTCKYVILVIVLFKSPVVAIYLILLLLWQNKRLDAQSKNKKLWLGGKP